MSATSLDCRALRPSACGAALLLPLRVLPLCPRDLGLGWLRAVRRAHGHRAVTHRAVVDAPLGRDCLRSDALAARAVTRDARSGRSVELLGMQIVPGPNLFVYLVENEDPLFPEDVTARFLSLSKLKSQTGDQFYAVPADVDLAAWGSVVVWCDTFKTAFAIATIERT